MSIVPILLMIAMLCTVGVLAVGIVGFLRGGEFNAKYGNVLMRARIGFQLVAVVLLGLLFLMQS